MRTLTLIGLLALMPPQFRNGIIEITVLDAVTREAIPAARVSLTLGPSYEPFVVAPVFSDNEGRAIFKGLPHGVYEWKVERDGYVVTAATTGSSRSLFIREEAPRQPIEALLNRVATITGRVLTPAGIPIADAEVTPLAVSFRLGLRTLTRVSGEGSRTRPVVTNDLGEYRISGLPAGEYFIRVDNSQTLEVQSRSNLVRSFYYPGVASQREAIPVAVRDSDPSGIDIKMPAGPLYKISGTVTATLQGRNEGLPMNRVFYMASAERGNIEEPFLFGVPVKALPEPGVSSFEIRGIPPGVYYLYPSVDSVQERLATRTLVTVEDKDVENLRILLKESPEIKGRIVVSGSNPDDIRWADVRVGLQAKEPVPLLFSLPPTVALDPMTRTFTLTGMMEDVRFGLGIGGLPPDAYMADLRQGGVSVYNDGVIRSTTGGEIEIAVSLLGGRVEGIVRNPSAEAVAKAGVVLVPSFPRRGNSQLYKRGITDAAGRFSFRGVAPGDYEVFAWPTLPRGGELNEEYLAPYDALGVPVKVAAGSSNSVQVSVIPFQR